MKIVLVRHAKPALQIPKKISSSDFKHWIDQYDASGIRKNEAPAFNTLNIASECNVILCSHLKRSIETACLLGKERIITTDSVFREAQLPYTSSIPLTLNPYHWAIIFRILWFLGYAKNGESFLQTKLRVKLAVDKLIAFAGEFSSVLLVGHGIMNRLIANELRTQGWKGPKDPGKQYWEFGVYTLTLHKKSSS